MGLKDAKKQKRVDPMWLRQTPNVSLSDIIKRYGLFQLKEKHITLEEYFKVYTGNADRQPLGHSHSESINPGTLGVDVMFEDNEGNKATEQLPDGALRDKDGLLLISKSKHQGLAQWTPTHQFIWTKKFQLPLPNNFSAWPFCPIDSVATPAYFDISTLTIPLTACELLTFFPCHIWISELQNRFSRNQIKGTFQAIFIDYQRDLTIPHVITPQQVRSLIKTAARACPPNSKSCSTYTVDKYRFTLPPRIPEKCGVEIKIPYTLIHCADGVNPAKFPKGSDAGPFTRALIHARTRNQDIMLNELDGYIARWGISRELDRLYSDPSLTDRYANEVKEYARGLRDTAKAKGYKWDC
ncbi:hypothetical protein PtrM4_122250 [Pyrenophora tritici-repentis]|uniref:Uncharacterized protein n=1 Tax=Pyrenophora tritici-repentis TaxID=45151 RepID=A0A2W1CPU5_9PLEO|nr:hypothetical protein A1F99_088900 [Pyrenophora tritici-repentis]KAF7569810.1 hypothetical protein PtrM4_122250 [Pyrenophora tritici-repentis]KAI0571048.1 hypothetical protein Alg215_10654 [Pyrenophora tritici-repentis]KAI1562360.1 hypothetical protein PtrEW4_010013 [Pyrenophora tritici-repentis]KAI1565195.1 hypothetical protein PtrEW7m1_009981 [Pyrenophora tritici-repentis]